MHSRVREKGLVVAGIAIITEACIDVKDRACVDVCPVQCIYEYDPAANILFSEVEAGNGVIENTHQPDPEAIVVFAESILYVNTEECTSCTACYQPDVCPVGAIYADEHVPDGTPRSRYNGTDPNKGHDHTFFIQHSRDVFAD
jgi:Fe-S-cluster-containing hydrogenase component 2